MKIGILGAADIAKRRFLPAIMKCNEADFVMLAVSSENRLEAGKALVSEFGGKAVVSYEALLEDSEIEAVYIPLPPSLHYEWAKRALQKGKHVFLEKPSTLSLSETEELVNIAKEKGLAIIENYGFVRHPQTKLIHDLIEEGQIGELRNIRTAFGFPKRPLEDIRHQSALGGGAMYDAGGYTIQLGFDMLGETAEVVTASLSNLEGYEVDMFGSLTMENAEGLTVQASFGMDCFYKCEVEIWGQKGTIKAPRLFTAPDTLKPQIIITTADGEKIIEAECADQFLLQLEYFIECIKDEDTRYKAYDEITAVAEQTEYAFDLAR